MYMKHFYMRLLKLNKKSITFIVTYFILTFIKDKCFELFLVLRLMWCGMDSVKK